MISSQTKKKYDFSRVINLSVSKIIELIQLKNNGELDNLELKGFIKDWKSPVKESIESVLETLLQCVKETEFDVIDQNIPRNIYGKKGNPDERKK